MGSSVLDYSVVTSTTLLIGETIATGWKDFFINLDNVECPINASTCRFTNVVFSCGTGSTMGVGESCTYTHSTAVTFVDDSTIPAEKT